MGVQKNYLDGIVAGAAKRDGLGNLIDKHYINKKDAIDVKGIILTSPSGTKFKITVDDEGNLQTSQITT